jgi:Terminase large subunit, endonuclease domain
VTVCAALVAGWCGTVLAPRFRSHLLPGEEYAVGIVATSREQAGVALGFVRRFLAASALLAEQVVAETADSISLAGGCLIEAIPCSARSSRGRANGVVILDEAAHFVDSGGNASLAALLDALKPGLAQFGSLGLLLAVSTPLDAAGAFYELERQAASGRFGDMAAIHLPTVEAMPQLHEEAERERLRNPRRYLREWAGEYSSDEESFPLAAFDACVDPDYQPPDADPGRVSVFALDGAVSRDAMALVGVDAGWNLIYARAWHPPKGGTIDHGQVLAELLDLAERFAIVIVAYDPNQVHGLVLDALQAGLPMVPVSQAAGRAGGTMARHAAAFVEALHERRLRLYPSPELRQHVARSRFSARSGGDRLVKARSADKIDLAVAAAMAVGVLADLVRKGYWAEQVTYELVSAADYLGPAQSSLYWGNDEYRPGPDDRYEPALALENALVDAESEWS